ncbi:hypothetical protein WG66_011325 [Moniliophthora roreri]|nr:hypothetical protein WG66_011325 [Moniliophthora roreri]
MSTGSARLCRGGGGDEERRHMKAALDGIMCFLSSNGSVRMNDVWTDDNSPVTSRLREVTGKVRGLEAATTCPFGTLFSSLANPSTTHTS